MNGAKALGLAIVVALCAGCTSPSSDLDEANEIEVFGTWRDTDADRFAEVLAGFEEDSGIDVRYVGSVDFVDDLLARTGDVGNPPDVAMVPQPALVRQLAATGEIVPLSDAVQDTVVENFGPDGADLGSIDGISYGVPYRVTVKSLVWYRPDVFAERGWTLPATLDELTDLVERIAADGDIAPWCLGINAGSATGWAATDWTEDLVLRSLGPERYQQWADGVIEFSDPDIADAFDQFRALALDMGRSLGGVRGIVETPVDEAIQPLLDDPPGCAMHRQADFAENWLPDGTTIGPDGDIDVFILPGITDAAPPLVIGGTQAVQFERGSDIDALMAYLASPEAAMIWARRGGFLSLNDRVPDDAYRDDFLRQLTAAIDEAPAVAFDASDQMSPEVGADLLWDGITAWVAGTDGYATFAAAIDQARAGGDASAIES